MKKSSLKMIAITSLLLLTEVFSENLKTNPTNKKFDSVDQSDWVISHNFYDGSYYSQAIVIPFNYPFEASLIPGATKPNNLNSIDFISKFNFSTPSAVSSGKVILKPSENTELAAYNSNIVTDSNQILRDTNLRMPSPWQRNSTVANTTSGFVFAYLKKNIGFNIDLSLRMIGNEAGQAVLDSVSSGLSFSYRISDRVFQMNPNYRLNLIFQVSSMQYTDERAMPKKLEFSKNLRSQFISSGFTLNTRSVMFEGLIRLPVHQQAMFDLDGLLRPELQGRLGMKWYLPEYIQP
ncbi:MAG TPA: hypothetical protein PK079_01030 [Leptospiraceae bacterium]|nr:hypothetical protein [Leptospiraceae bacterium]HMW03904.1 hypothetical protein [Leptospiraceae bacterium]HMX32382.1 hypothetical protein [Leptospiraceae bacterium]HMY29884.1 hypothetical protein [Leptospiraceae bacterium]HMZ62972.1 hypothetical protein [Leptospiraceae bacterium]